MIGLWLENKCIILKDDLQKPEPSDGESLIRVLMAGICNTDIELTKGYYPYVGVLGHEFVGIVEKGPPHLLNKKVVGEINVVCQKCDSCLNGLKSHCYNRSVLGIANKNGAFSEFLTLPNRNLYEVPENVSTEEATFTEPLAAALEIQQQINILPEDKVVVIGDGKLGNLITQTLLLTGCELWLLGKHPRKYKFLEKKGVKIIDKDNIKLSYFDIVVECTGNPEGFELAMRMLKPRGKLVMKSTYAVKLHIDVSKIVVNEISLIGSRCGPFQPALRLLERKLIDLKPLIDHIYLLDDALNAFEHAKRKGSMKILLENIV